MPINSRPTADALQGGLIALIALLGGFRGWSTCNQVDAQQPLFFPQSFVQRSPEARVELAAGRLLRELAQIDSLVEAEAWEEAIDGIMRLVDQSPDELVAIADDHYLPLRDACQLRIARWPTAALVAYRGRVDAMAASRLNRAMANRSEVKLQLVANEYFCSHSGDDALLALGDLALERGAYSSARGYWQQISPALAAPDGRPWGVALVGTDLDDAKVWEQVKEQFASPSVASTRLAFPDSEIPVADLLARLAMVSIREGSFARAEVEKELIRRLYPEDVGRMAGRESRLWQAVAGALSSARTWPHRNPKTEWPAFGGSNARGLTAAPLGDLSHVVWKHPLKTAPVPSATSNEPKILFNGQPVGQPNSLDSFVEPVVASGAVVFFSSGAIHAIDLESGLPVFGDTGEVYRESPINSPFLLGNSRRGGGRIFFRQMQAVDGGIVIRGGFQQRVFIQGGGVGVHPFSFAGSLPGHSRLLALEGSLDGSLDGSLEGSLIYATLGPREKQERKRPHSNPPTAPPRRLVVLDLAAEGKLELEIAPDEGCRFSGPVVVDGNRLYLPMRETNTSARLLVGCYVRSTGRQLWRSAICSFTGATGRESDILTLGDDLLFANTNAGVIAAVHKNDGRFVWARTYVRGPSTFPNDLSTVQPRPPGPCLFAGGALVCAPPDAPAIFALDPTNGRTLWTNEEAFDVFDLLGVTGETLVATGRRLWMIDIVSGESRSVWPESLGAGIEGSGRGCIAGHEVLWPTKESIYTFSVKTGQQTRSPLSTGKFKGDRVNLIPVGEQLLIATPKQLTLLGPSAPAKAGSPSDPQS